jgi:hypothetical protein
MCARCVCQAWDKLDPRVPDLRALDTLARCLFVEVSDVAPQLTFEKADCAWARWMASIE